jgi:hypothetical protein
MPEGVKVITVCDREGDRYELFTKAQSLNESLLIRIVRNRMTVGNKRILDVMRHFFEIFGEYFGKNIGKKKKY